MATLVPEICATVSRSRPSCTRSLMTLWRIAYLGALKPPVLVGGVAGARPIPWRSAWQCLALSPERQVQREVCVEQGPESKMRVEGFGRFVLCIQEQSVGCNLLAGLQTAVDGATQQKLAQAPAALIRSTRQAAHAKAGNRITWQLLAVRIGKSLYIDFGRAERVVAQDQLGLPRVGQHVDRTDAAASVLLGKAADVLVERRYAALEPLPIVDRRVERQILKHAEPCGVPGSVL